MLLGKDQQARLEVKERPDVGVYVKDLTSVGVNNADDMDKIMTMGNKNRSVGQGQLIRIQIAWDFDKVAPMFTKFTIKIIWRHDVLLPP